jgi:acetyl/propionyl-CoA carboxylase alpha subunit
MISKLCAFGATREEAIVRMRRALGEYHVGGIRTNLAFHRRVLRHPAFVAGAYDTGFIDRYRGELAPAELDETSAAFAAIGAALEARARPGAGSRVLDTSAVQPSAWRGAVRGPTGG